MAQVQIWESVWVSQDRKGDQGDTGPQGIQGSPQGEAGADGAPGPNEVSTNTATNITGLLKRQRANVWRRRQG